MAYPWKGNEMGEVDLMIFTQQVGSLSPSDLRPQTSAPPGQEVFIGLETESVLG